MTVENLTPEERETTWTGSDADDTVIIESTQRRRITELRKGFPEYEVASGHWGTTEWARFVIPTAEVRIARRRRRTLTDEQRADLAARAARNWNRPDPGL